MTVPGFAEVRDIYLMRIQLAELIGKMDPLPLHARHHRLVMELQGRANALSDAFDIQEYWRINHDLHLLIARIIGNSALRRMWDALYFQAARMWYQHARSDPESVAASLVAELAEVARAIEARDAVALGYTQRNHIAYGLARLEAAAAGDGVNRASCPENP